MECVSSEAGAAPVKAPPRRAASCTRACGPRSCSGASAVPRGASLRASVCMRAAPVVREEVAVTDQHQHTQDDREARQRVSDRDERRHVSVDQVERQKQRELHE
eukprot:4573451-Prymnesium_polylepis.1